MKEHWKLAEEFWRNFFVGAKGRTQPGSGNVAGKPGDIRFIERVRWSFDSQALLESKHTDQASLSIQKKWLNKIELEAAHMGRVPLVGLSFSQEHWLLVPSWGITQEQGE